ncbi:DUF2828 family protein [Brachyspira hyodysenteriae]|uniref:DUF2828 family protein n=2 Tax=Brachyspira hyodysenteriae TaxID=159 RepID=UPI001ADDDAAA|nr:DUF2828 family protein [Brachyspira hyodysenteriae]MBT8720178.1 DUF2828 family protein [Brachyspira hyodysenteriae]MBT8730416.1 DUF2828 family protein [Brachyspira hyodysenteriae]MBT8732735.1 DUF2828 family protein [Brachyspira hyodysenteriae]MBT8735521.1 DUF2828 family protein [Brachyspira hyodysenteriae]MBT8738133.1 DUF2828 family protein [Brachyspira hyodysenteriae]
MSFLDLLKNSFNKTYTQNFADTNISSLSNVIDLFATMGASRLKKDDELLKYFIDAWRESPELTAKCIMYLRDIRKGIGEREVFRKYINIMIKQNHTLTAIEILKTIPELGRWDDIIYIWYENRENKNISNFTKNIILEQLEKDKISNNVSLLAKWLPSENTSSKNTRNIARELIKLLNINTKEYRKTLSALRKKIKIIENNLREKDYTFNYSSVPSLAMRKYSKAFIRNDEERYNKFFEDVKSGKVKLNTSVLTHFDVIREILDCAEEDIDSRKEEFDLTWKNLPNIFGDSNLNAIVACDVSGSMGMALNGEPLICSVALGIYIAQLNKSAFHNHFIDFCGDSKMHDISNINNIVDIVDYVLRSSVDYSTNIDSVFKALLDTAIKNHVPHEELPKYIIIISDMEFNQCEFQNKTNFEYWKEIFNKNNYKLPRIIFWNVNSLSRIMPALKNYDVLFISGRSQNAIKNIINIDKYDLTNQDEISMFLILDTLKDYSIDIKD